MPRTPAQCRAALGNKCKTSRLFGCLCLVVMFCYIFTYSSDDVNGINGVFNKISDSNFFWKSFYVNATSSSTLERNKSEERTDDLTVDVREIDEPSSGVSTNGLSTTDVSTTLYDTTMSNSTIPLHWPYFDRARRVYAPWSSPTCRHYTVHYTRHLPPTALASYPGSGNTWARYLIETATGVHSGSVYKDDQLFLSGYRGEMEPWQGGTTLVQKTHEYTEEQIASFNGSGILLLRNPYRAVMAYHNFLFGGHKGYAPVAHYRRADWEPFLHVQIKGWLLTAVSWLQRAPHLTLIHYEDLQKMPGPSLTRVTDFLSLSTNTERLRCIAEHDRGHFKRVVEYLPEDVKLFSAHIRSKFDRAIRYVDTLARRRGLPSLPTHLYEFYNFTVSDQIVRVKCRDKETVDQCDYRLDLLNTNRKYSISTPSSSPHPVTPSGGGEEPATGAGSVQEDASLTIMERFTQNTVVSRVSDAIMGMIQQHTSDPVQALMRGSALSDFLAMPVPLEGVSDEEAQNIRQDYVWKNGRPPIRFKKSRS